jgi:hypothetical protein
MDFAASFILCKLANNLSFSNINASTILKTISINLAESIPAHTKSM